MLNALKRKCGTCGVKCRRDEMYRINMNFKDGERTLMICEACAKRLLVSEEVMIKNLGEQEDE